ncbi:MAG: nSTAND3 domain-containing NTPase [Burkholderiales bacterium]
MSNNSSVAHAYNVDFALHTLGWKAFQDLCAQICAETLGRTVSIYREAQDGGQDAVFLLPADKEAQEATIQCKFSGKSDQRLKQSDITAELSNVKELVGQGRARTYYFLTSMGVDAPVAAEIRDQLRELGVQEPHVEGREWITAQIKSSSRLRALVPRVYGLGDLSSILDERSAAQTRALLDHLLPSLRVYVPTSAHRTAVRTLADHKLVLLIGQPAIGKSMLAAILATMAIDTEGLECFKCEGPLNLGQHWNPHESKRLFWVDDAFGSNQLRYDYVDAWIEFMPKVKAAIENGNHFILTSRTHIWNEAALKLGTRNHHLLDSKKAVVNVGNLAPEERQQILYNHLKEGKQNKQWKQWIKEHLLKLSDNLNLLPEIARRLGDPRLTTGIKQLPDDLIRFVHVPQEYLKKTIFELTLPQQAAMTLVFLARSRLPVYDIAGEDCKLVADRYGTSVAAITQSLQQLGQSFVVKREESGQLCWAFFHPTFADAISSILSARSDLVDLYLGGAKIETLLAEAICEGAATVKDAVIVPARNFDTLVTRLQEVSDESNLNERLFLFLNRRATNEVFREVLTLKPDLITRKGSPSPWSEIANHAEICFHAKAYSMELLDEDVRYSTCETLTDAATYHLDVSFLWEEDILAMFKPHELMRLTVRLVAMLEDKIPGEIDELTCNGDADSDIDDQFSSVDSFVRKMQYIAEEDEHIVDRLDELERTIEKAKAEVKARKSEDEDDGSFFTNVPSATLAKETASRSIFSDVDE